MLRWGEGRVTRSTRQAIRVSVGMIVAGLLRRPLATMGVVCLLMAGCTAKNGESVNAEPTLADQPTAAPTTRGAGALTYGVDGDIYVADWDGSNPVRIADGRPPTDCDGIGEYFAEESIWSPDGRYLAYRHTDCDAARDECCGTS